MLQSGRFFPNPVDNTSDFLTALTQFSQQAAVAVNSRTQANYNETASETGGQINYDGVPVNVWRQAFSVDLSTSSTSISIALDDSVAIISIVGAANKFVNNVLANAVQIPYTNGSDYIAVSMSSTAITVECASAFIGYKASLIVEFAYI